MKRLFRLLRLLKQFWPVLSRFSLFNFWQWAGGRTFVFILLVMMSGYVLERSGKLTSQYVALVSILAGLFTARAVLDDHINGKPDAGDKG